MKKIILTTLLMVLIPLIGHAATYEITTPGNNIGIGSTAPGQALDVQGTIRTSGAVIANGSGASFTSGNLGVGTALTINALDVNGAGVAIGPAYAGKFTAPTNGLIVQGAVGIGTATNICTGDLVLGAISPASCNNYATNSVLTAGANYSGGGFLTANYAYGPGFGTGSAYITGDGGGTTSDIVNIFADNKNLLEVGGGGNIGIGTTPVGYYPFNISANGNISIGTSATTSSALVIMGGNTGIGSLTPGQLLDVQGTVRDIGENVNGNAIISNVGIGTNQISTTDLLSIYQNGNRTVGVNSSGNLFSFAGNEFQGVVGSSPANGAVVITPSNGQNGVVYNPSGTPLFYDLWLNSSNVGVDAIGGTGNLGVGTSNTSGGALVVVGGNVGIGSLTPGSNMDVQGTIRILGGGSFLVGTGTGFTVNSSGGVSSIDGTSSSNLSNSNLSFANSGSIAIIKNNESTSNSGMNYIGSVATNGFVNIQSTSGVGSGDLVKITGGNNGATNIATFFGTGNIGIGTTLGDSFIGIKSTSGSASAGPVICLGVSSLGQACIGKCTAISTDTCTCTCLTGSN